MKNNALVNDLKLLLAEFLEEEKAAEVAGNKVFLSALQFARVNLEVTLEKHGYSRTSTIENNCEKLINSK